PVKSAESAESAAGAGNESGRFIVQSLTEKTVDSPRGLGKAEPPSPTSLAAPHCFGPGGNGGGFRGLPQPGKFLGFFQKSTDPHGG
ncbi:hypothetical protein H0E87_031525, partial [Populus deltoides]